jgi:hypothetical protein
LTSINNNLKKFSRKGPYFLKKFSIKKNKITEPERYYGIRTMFSVFFEKLHT